MSILIDILVEQVKSNNTSTEINGKWYIAKWYGWRGAKAFPRRFKDAFRVLIGKSRAYHFKEDE